MRPNWSEQQKIWLDLFWLTHFVWNKELLSAGFCGWSRLVFCCPVFQEIRSPNNQLAEQEPECWELFEDYVNDEPTSERKQIHRWEWPWVTIDFDFSFFLKAEGCCGTQPGINTWRYPKASLGKAAGTCDAQRPSLPRRLKLAWAVLAVRRCWLCTAGCFWPLRCLFRWAVSSVSGPGLPAFTWEGPLGFLC